MHASGLRSAEILLANQSVNAFRAIHHLRDLEVSGRTEISQSGGSIHAQFLRQESNRFPGSLFHCFVQIRIKTYWNPILSRFSKRPREPVLSGNAWISGLEHAQANSRPQRSFDSGEGNLAVA